MVNVNDIGNVVRMSDWESMDDGRYKAVVRPMDLDKWAIFGSLTLVRRHDFSYGFFNDTYDFEMHNSFRIDEILRNVNTKLGDPICGSLSGCTGFQIKFIGNYDYSRVYRMPLQ